MLLRIDRYKCQNGTGSIETHTSGIFILNVYGKDGNCVIKEQQPSIAVAKMALEKYLGSKCVPTVGNLIIDELNSKEK